MTAMVYSIQQIKYEFLCYIKEFGGRAGDWRVGAAVDARDGLFRLNGVDMERDIWLWKPALSTVAARTIVTWFTRQFHVPSADQSHDGTQVFIFKPGAAVAICD